MCLTPFELKDHVPFGVKRLYWITDAEEGSASGQHCHLKEEEVFVCLMGEATMVMDQGSGKEEVVLTQGRAIYIPNHVWHGFTGFSRDAVVLAISSTNYSADRSDYCEEYEVYVKEYRPNSV